MVSHVNPLAAPVFDRKHQRAYWDGRASFYRHESAQEDQHDVCTYGHVSWTHLFTHQLLGRDTVVAGYG
jgi:hypothetical protein